MRILLVVFIALLAQLSFGRGAPVATIDLTLSPTSVIGGNSTTATVTISEAAPVGGAEVSIYSTLPSLAGVPASVVIPEGETSVSFQVVTSPVNVSGTVGITAIYQGVGTAALLHINPSSTTDLVIVFKAQYDAKKRLLKVEASSSTPTATLSVLKTSTGSLIGTLAKAKNGRYTGTFSVAADPVTVTVASSEGGSATVNTRR